MAATFWNVTGEGPPNAKVVLVGEAPGAVESTRLRPFVGQAGQLLRQGLLSPIICSKIFITNILACRPPKNRDPFSDEEEVCADRLRELFAILQPKLVVAVGRVAETCLIDVALFPLSDPSINFIRRITFVYHPAFLLRNGVTIEALSKKKIEVGPTKWPSYVEQALEQYKQLREIIVDMYIYKELLWSNQNQINQNE